MVVVVGLWFATQSAIDGWSIETSKLQGQIDELDQQIAAAPEDERTKLIEQRNRLQSNLPSLRNLRWNWIALAGFLYAAGLVPPGFLLGQSVRCLGESPKMSTAIAAQLLGHLGKYVPGKAMVIVLRSGALAKDNVRVLPASISVFMETFLMMAVGAVIAGVITFWLPVPQWIKWMALLAAIAASIPTLPPVLQVVARRVAKTDDPIGIKQLSKLFLSGWIYSLVSWVLIGAAFACLIVAIPTSTPLPSVWMVYGIATAAVSLAIVAGFASLIPGGAGVRELVLTSILGVSLGAGHGLLAAVAARILFILVEGLLGLFSWLWLSKRFGNTD